jgi:hypothetical protein
MEHLINESLGTNVLHVHFEAGTSDEWDVQLRALLRVEATLDAIVNEGHETTCNDDTT